MTPAVYISFNEELVGIFTAEPRVVAAGAEALLIWASLTCWRSSSVWGPPGSTGRS